ncbi:MAG: hypothetical protein AAFN13_00465 [Bacteroidota bacterium]
MRFTILVLTLLAATPTVAQPTDAELSEYVRDAWGLVSLTDEIAVEMMPLHYNGIPYRSWIGFFFEIPDVLDPLRRGAYGEAALAAGLLAANRSIDISVAQAGFAGVSATAQLATLPIEIGLRSFQRGVAEVAFEKQVALYFEARGNHSAQAILDAPPPLLLTGDGIPITKDDQGWLYRRGAQHVPGMTPEEVYEFAEALWQASNEQATLAAFERDLAQDFASRMPRDRAPSGEKATLTYKNFQISYDLSRTTYDLKPDHLIQAIGDPDHQREGWLMYSSMEFGQLSANYENEFVNRLTIRVAGHYPEYINEIQTIPSLSIGDKKVSVMTNSIPDAMRVFPGGCEGDIFEAENSLWKNYYIYPNSEVTIVFLGTVYLGPNYPLSSITLQSADLERRDAHC